MIAPHELKNKVFNKSVRGYNCSEVDEYIEFLLDQYTELYRENSDLKNDLHKTKVKYNELHNDEDTIRAVIIKAQKLGETIVQKARKEADGIIDSAKEKCQSKIDEAEQKVVSSQKEIDKIKELAETYRNGLYEQYLEHIKLLKGMDFSFPLPAENDIRNEVTQDIEEDSEKAKEKIVSITSTEE